MLANKACPVVLRRQGALEILAFRHPLAGLQLVKGTREPGESTSAAALRELAEEAGLEGLALRPLGLWQCALTGQTWAFHECQVADGLPEAWSHFCTDDSGHLFRFFWHPLASEPSDEWHPLFQGALAYLRQQLLGADGDA